MDFGTGKVARALSRVLSSAAHRITTSTSRTSRRAKRVLGGSSQGRLESTLLLPVVVPEIDVNPMRFYRKWVGHFWNLTRASCVSCRDVTQHVEFGLKHACAHYANE